MSISESYPRFVASLPEDVTLLAVSKYAADDQIQELISSGQRLFGENKVQDGLRKKELFSTTPGVKWHLIGHLQTNKVNKAVSTFDCIQTVDSLRLAEKINDAAARLGKRQSIYIQINVANDPSKFGYEIKSLKQDLSKLFSFLNVSIEGIMTIAPNIKEESVLSVFFKDCKILFDTLRAEHPELRTLSMGMSQDYALAMANGANMIRVGSLLTN
ncbi:YggS family pyridoxal phosphate-dependent enzyme [bacterium]|jgi:PLP dependent protein|nr:YggS family pyridoxal phosphate-dependent enzyme [bacterium]